MKYNVTINGKLYEVDVERVSPFHQMTREEIATGVVAAPVAAPAPVAAWRMYLRNKAVGSNIRYLISLPSRMVPRHILP